MNRLMGSGNPVFRAVRVCVVFLSCSLFAVGILAQAPLREGSPGGSKTALPKGASMGWWAAVQKQIRHDEYQIDWTDHPSVKNLKGAWQAPNMAQNFLTYFTQNGIDLVPRAGGASVWQWGLSLRRWGRPGAATAAAPADLTVSKNRADYSRSGIREWYVNSQKGLEQGFTIDAPPAAAGASSHKTQIGGK
ncbi:MAG: hypothetical protein P8Z49_06500 [Acidobacteriota bacterium]